MKTKKCILLIVAILSASCLMVNVSNRNNHSAELFLFQIEALASGESSGQPICTARKACDMHGSFVECKGYESCEVGFISVTCDGRKHTC